MLAETLETVTDVTFEAFPTDHALPFHGALYDDVYDRTVEFLQSRAVGASERPPASNRTDTDVTPGAQSPGDSGIDGPPGGGL